MDEDDPKQVCYTLYVHPAEWEGIKEVFWDGELVFAPLTDVPRNGEPAAPMTHVLVLPDKVDDVVVKARWYVNAEHTHPHWRTDRGLTEVQWSAMLDFCKLFLKAYEHLGGKS